jgi:SAM-dependent methyltransferase
VDNEIIYGGLNDPKRLEDLIIRYCADKEVLDIGCVNHDPAKQGKSGWVHEDIRKVAKETVGMDILEEAAADLNKRGYNIITADISKPVKLEKKFDVIFAGNIIEHLSNFEGFWKNITGLLKDKGVILVATPNPFYMDQYFYSAFKGRVLINPEHTCWIDPVAMGQLAGRFGFDVDKVFWLSKKWRLPQVICYGDHKKFNMMKGKWEFYSSRGLIEKLSGPFLVKVCQVFFPKNYARLKEMYAEDMDRTLFIKFIDIMFSFLWGIYKTIIVRSKLNKYELYLAVMSRKIE